MASPNAISPSDVDEVLTALRTAYPVFKTELTYDSPFQLLIAVILSAQCTDARVNLTTPALFRQFPDAARMSRATLKQLETLIKSCGFYRMKALALKKTATVLVEKHGGEVPRTLEELVELGGVGRKTASVVLNQAYDIPAIAVDTHVKRVSFRLGWTQYTQPEKIERELKELVPMKDWAAINGLLILHGRRICKARKPLCESCVVKHHCRYYATEFSSAAPKKAKLRPKLAKSRK